MNLDLTGKSALVCGSTQGIGRACAVELANLGAECVLFARNEGTLADVARSLPTPKGQKHSFLSADFARPDDVGAKVKGAVAAGQAFHIVINNTGGPPGGTAIDATPEQYLAAFNAQLISAQVIAQAVVPGMKQARFGRFVNIISTSVKQPIPNLGVSNTARAAVASWAKTLSAELGPFGITVNNILPGYTRTERLDELIEFLAEKESLTPDEIRGRWEAEIPMRRLGEPHEFGALAAFLVSERASYITGSSMAVDGGWIKSLF